MLVHMTGDEDTGRSYLLVLFIQPSSAAAKVFSLLQNSFTQQQSSLLEDNLNCASLIHNYFLTHFPEFWWE